MKLNLTVLGAAVLLAACTVNPQPGISAEQPNLLVMGEDADKDTVPRNSRVFKRVLNALASEMDDVGFNVYDEPAVTLGDFAQGRTRRTDAELIDIAKSLKRPPIDVAVIFGIYASEDKLSYTTKIRTRVEGRLLNVKSGKRLGNFEVELPEPKNAPVFCNRECLLETVGKNAKMISRDLGVVLAKKLDWLVKDSGSRKPVVERDKGGLASAYTLIFEGFTPDEISDIEEYIVAFKGYEHHRLVKNTMRHAEYWYESGSVVARLNRNMRRMLDHLGVEGRITFAGNKFTVEKISLRKER